MTKKTKWLQLISRECGRYRIVQVFISNKFPFYLIPPPLEQVYPLILNMENIVFKSWNKKYIIVVYSGEVVLPPAPPPLPPPTLSNITKLNILALVVLSIYRVDAVLWVRTIDWCRCFGPINGLSKRVISGSVYKDQLCIRVTLPSFPSLCRRQTNFNFPTTL